MAVSPLNENSDLATFSILVDGSIIDSTVEVLAITVENELNAPSQASVQLIKSGRGDKSLSRFTPGAELVIQLGYNSRNTAVFQGIITGQSLATDATGGTIIEVQAQEKAALMTVERKSRSFTEKTAADVIQDVVAEYGIVAQVDAAAGEVGSFEQDNQTDWDFLEQVAQGANLLLYTSAGKLFAEESGTNKDAALKLTYGEDVYSAMLNADALAGLVSGSKKVAKSGVQAEVSGSVSFPGSALAALNTPVELAGFGGAYNGLHLISSVYHHLAEGVWQTNVDVGLPVVARPVASTTSAEEEEAPQAVVAITTAGGNQLTLSDEAGTILLQDQHANQILLSEDGILVKSSKDLNLEAPGSINITADQHLNFWAKQGNLRAKGITVDLDAQASLKAQGGASAELSAGGNTTVKGAIVMIN